MKIIAFTGLPASGKSVAVEVGKNKGIPVIRMGDLVWEETRKQGQTLNDKNVGNIANIMRKRYGKNIWAKRTVEKINSLKKSSHLIIDGVRNIEEIEYFKKELGSDFFVVAIDATNELRRKRVIARGRIDDSKDLNSFIERDNREIQWGVQKVMADADIVILNNGSLDQFKKQIINVLQKL